MKQSLKSITHFTSLKSHVEIIIGLFIVIFLTGISSVSGQNLKWPDGKKATIVLSYDEE